MNNHTVSISGMLTVALVLMNAVILETAVVKNENWYKALWVTLPLLAIALYQAKKKKIPAEKTPEDTSLILKK